MPEEALIQRSDGAVLFKIGAENRVRRVAVTTGAHDGGRVEVRGDVHPGERVVRRGHGGLADGAQVAVRDAEPRAVAEQKGDGVEGAAL